MTSESVIQQKVKSGLEGRKVKLHDMSLRDGMHAKREQIPVEMMVKIAKGLDAAGVPYMQVTHGAGLGGNSIQHGRALASNAQYISAVAEVVKQAVISVLLIPGLGTMKELEEAYQCGARSVHVATHCTEADTSPQHIAFARKLGMDASGFLMMSHLNSAEGLTEQALLMESYGANTVYVTDSAGAMLTHEVTHAIAMMRDALKSETEIGFHGHHNLGLGIANSIAAIGAGATRIDASLAGLGAGAGNAPIEVLAAVCDRMEIETGSDTFALMDLAEDVVVPFMDHVVRADREALTLGFAGVYSTFLLPAKRAGERFGIPARDILVELGRKKMIGGQEDMIQDTAMTMARERGLLKESA
ncbi:4-hydroxy-2-oxovalerate aldolase [Thioclava sp. F36-6]|uniref:4-hydroxy-2-oxovalerate aldolase n=1 Tax=Thioclava sp. F36-6 TaxID=1915316 RepID=UPI000997C916|nr:4-hydroxy-2-oxovalerate aldolase [Thioclava sp. F36-6]OOY33443.1 4-hydroxy-2-oxovalerate aldolase [Thioclava sp. F36-6]